jgi:hypothetical protein
MASHDFQRQRVLARARAGDVLSRSEVAILVSAFDDVHAVAERALDRWQEWAHGKVSDSYLAKLEPELVKLRARVRVYPKRVDDGTREGRS